MVRIDNYGMAFPKILSRKIPSLNVSWNFRWFLLDRQGNLSVLEVWVLVGLAGHVVSEDNEWQQSHSKYVVSEGNMCLQGPLLVDHRIFVIRNRLSLRVESESLCLCCVNVMSPHRCINCQHQLNITMRTYTLKSHRGRPQPPAG